MSFYCIVVSHSYKTNSQHSPKLNNLNLFPVTFNQQNTFMSHHFFEDAGHQISLPKNNLEII